jgi:hypothetical protein
MSKVTIDCFTGGSFPEAGGGVERWHLGYAIDVQ